VPRCPFWHRYAKTIEQCEAGGGGGNGGGSPPVWVDITSPAYWTAGPGSGGIPATWTGSEWRSNDALAVGSVCQIQLNKNAANWLPEYATPINLRIRFRVDHRATTGTPTAFVSVGGVQLLTQPIHQSNVTVPAAGVNQLYTLESLDYTDNPEGIGRLGIEWDIGGVLPPPAQSYLYLDLIEILLPGDDLPCTSSAASSNPARDKPVWRACLR
jgi:hypothetical protein